MPTSPSFVIRGEPQTIAGMKNTPVALLTIRQNGFVPYKHHEVVFDQDVRCDFCLDTIDYGPKKWIFLTKGRHKNDRVACESCMESAISMHLDWCEGCKNMQYEDGRFEVYGDVDAYDLLGKVHNCGPIPIGDYRP